RHTRFSRDWSSDVCSSDLSRALPVPALARPSRSCHVPPPEHRPVPGRDRSGRTARRRRCGAAPLCLTPHVQHHEDTLAAYVAAVSASPETVAVVATGSAARGTERPDSDVDVYLVVTEPAFARAEAAERLS